MNIFNQQTGKETRQQGRKTIAVLLRFAAKELNSKGPSDFDLDTVLKRSKVSKGSLYHHFGSRNGLIVAVEIEHLKQGLNKDNEVLRAMVVACTDKDQFLSIIELVIRTGASEPTREVRRQLIRAITLSKHDKKLAQAIQQTSIVGTTYLAETLQIAQSKGWIRPEVNLLAFAYWLQGVFLGQLMLEITEITDLGDDWHTITMTAVKTFLT